MTKFLWMAALAAGMALALVPSGAEAKRLGGAKSSGMQRNVAPDKPPPQSAPAAPAAAPTTPATPPTAAAAPKRSWMGPIAGLAAGLGIAALFSHLGLGDELANFVMIGLLVMVALFAVRWLMRRFAGGGAERRPLSMATAGAARSAPIAPAAPVRFVDERPGMQRQETPSPVIGSALQPPLAVPGLTGGMAAATLPAGFDAEGFERLAKMLFIRMQAANDSADLGDLRHFTTPELFASLRLDLQDRGDAKQTTDVVKVDAKLIDFAEDGERQIVSVRFHGLIREEPGAEPAAFDEVWHLVKPTGDDRPWAIAGIQQAQ